MAEKPESRSIDMEKYKRVRKEKEEKEDSKKDEIRISSKGRTSNYISYAGKLFNEDGMDSFVIKATGQALATAVTVCEIIKRRFKGIHQITKIGSIEIEDEYEPKSKDDDLENIKQIRNVSFIEITLSKVELDTADRGYQPPLPEDQVEEKSPEELAERRSGRKGGKKSKGKGKRKYSEDDDDDDDDERSPKGKGKKGKKGKGKDSKGKGKGKKGKDSKGKGKGKSDKGKGKSSKGKGKGKKGKKGGDDSDDE